MSFLGQAQENLQWVTHILSSLTGWMQVTTGSRSHQTEGVRGLSDGAQHGRLLAPIGAANRLAPPEAVSEDGPSTPSPLNLPTRLRPSLAQGPGLHSAGVTAPPLTLASLVTSPLGPPGFPSPLIPARRPSPAAHACVSGLPFLHKQISQPPLCRMSRPTRQRYRKSRAVFITE